MSKSKEQEIFEKCIKMYLPIHNFMNNTRAVFYKGFKFEKCISCEFIACENHQKCLNK